MTTSATQPTVTNPSLTTAAPSPAAPGPDRYEGRYCAGTGDADFLRLIDESFAFFHPSPDVPNVTMLYQPDWNTFEEGAGWNAWWIQNSYGFSYAITPFLQEPWLSILQRSWDLFWDNQGDGKRPSQWGGSSPQSRCVGPDGCLGDTAAPGQIIWKQGDGDLTVHDWFYEATAAGVVMQAELLLAGRDPAALAHYLPKMARACDFIETSRDPRNNLFLVGPACNLLAPSYGGVKQPDGSFGKGYLAGLSITYLAALDRMVELYRLAGDPTRLAAYQRRQEITRESLRLLLAPAGYFVKSVEPNGTRHGVLGQAQFGYLEGVANVDAVALRVADDATARSIYRQIASFPAIRPFDFLLTNAPGLDDTYWNWGQTTGGEVPGQPEIGIYGARVFGDWVNGGVWGTVEGRAILSYYRLRQFEDIRRSATRALHWAQDFRMDAPWSQWGENTHNVWSDGQGDHHTGGVAIMVDNFAIPAATIRGLFDYEYRCDRLILRPRVPATITEYAQKQPVRFGAKTLHLSCRNGGPKITAVTVNGQAVPLESPEAVVLRYDELPAEASVAIVTEGGWEPGPAQPPPPSARPRPTARVAAAATPVELPASLKTPEAVLTALARLLSPEPNADYERAFVGECLAAIAAWRKRSLLDPGPGTFRPITPPKRALILKFYEQAALRLYQGLSKQVAAYAQSPDAAKQHLAELFQRAAVIRADKAEGFD